MNDISVLNSDKAKYNNMKDAINRVINNLEDAIDYIKVASNKIATNNCINEERADGNKVEAYKNNLVNQVDWLRNKVLPAIDQSIDSCDLQIDKLLAAAAAVTVVTTPVITPSTPSVTETPSNNQNVEAPKVNVTTPTVKQSTKITSNTPVNKMKTKTTVKTSNLNALKKITTKTVNSIISKLGSLFK